VLLSGTHQHSHPSYRQYRPPLMPAVSKSADKSCRQHSSSKDSTGRQFKTAVQTTKLS